MTTANVSPTLIGRLSLILDSVPQLYQRNAVLEAITALSDTDDKDLAVLQLEDKYCPGDCWGQHPKFRRQWWKDEVHKDDTQVSYWEWVFNQIQGEAT